MNFKRFVTEFTCYTINMNRSGRRNIRRSFFVQFVIFLVLIKSGLFLYAKMSKNALSQGLYKLRWCKT